jgi:DNA-binding beta-propeller fold protein YncE/mono/diheme cytochrome c family protein
MPAQSRWVLEQAPAGNDNAVVPGADGYARFTPVVAGDYAFRVAGTDVRRTLTVVADVPYEHFNYYPTTSLARVGPELWVAHGFDPHVSRIDPDSGRVLGTIAVGPWPSAIASHPALPVALVTHKAGDTLGFVDIEAGRLVDAVWVGDEPAAVVISPDGATAYVSLATENAVAVIDVARREVVGRIAANVDPGVMAISEDGATLYVASYRSAVGNRLQFPADARNDLYDIAVVDTATRQVRDHIAEVGSTIGGLLLDGDTLYVATTRVAVEELSGAEGMTAFRHSVAAYDTSTLAEVAAADLGRQPSSTGWAVRPFGLALAGGTLWVALEGSDAVVGLDPSTLAETARFAAEGRPRAILSDDDRLYVHGLQAYTVTIADSAGTVTGTAALAGDPRGASLSLGQRLYTGTGARAGENHSCADCHVDGLTDGNVWSAGGFSESTSRPMFWLEGPRAVGWEGDAWDLWSYIWGSPGPTIGATIDTALHLAFYDYLAALVPPPPANGLTRRDGSLSDEARRGEALFVGAGACAGCHAGPMKTQGLRLPGGGTQSDHPIVVPSLVGAYRHTFWLVNGAARSLEEATAAMLPLSGGSLDEGELADVARYLGELTARDFFVLETRPRAGDSRVRREGPLEVVLSHPVLDDPDNLARITLQTADGGSSVPVTVEADARYVTVTPAAALEPGQRYALVVGAGFEAWAERTLAADEVVTFTVAGVPSLRLEGDYVITVDHPNLDFANKRYDSSVIIPVKVPMVATPTSYGAALVSQVTELLRADYDVVIDGDTAYFPPFTFPVGPGFLNRSFPSQIVLRDDDGDGIADAGESTLLFRSPGLEALDVRWTIARDDGGPVECSGMEGTHEVSLALEDGGPVVDWTADVEALGYYVTDPDATPPAGPGPVTGGETYWAVATASFPTGFGGPVRYGQVPTGGQDVSTTSGAPAGGAALPTGACIKLTLVFTDFSSTVLRYVAP